MSFGFLHPVFFAGLAILAVPVLIHLVAQREARGRAFPSLMFLRNIPIKRARRRTLRDPLLLILRALALTLLVLAFAGPYLLDNATPATETATTRQTVIAVDRSYSMRFDGRWERALARAGEEIDRLPANARAALVLFDDEPHTVAPLTGDKLHLRQALTSAKAGHAGTDYARVLAHVPQLFDASLGGKQAVLLISDLQLSGLQNDHTPRLVQPIELALENVAREQPGDTLLTNVQVLGSDADSARVNLVASLGVDERDAGSTEQLRVRVDSHVAEVREISETEIAAGAVALSVVPARDHVSQLELSVDGQTVAHSYRLTLAQVKPIKVMLLSSEDAAHSAVYLQQALALATRPKIVVQRVASAALNDAVLANTDVVIIDDAAMQDSGSIARIEQFVNTGGGLLTIAGEHPRVGAPLLATPLVPGTLGDELADSARLTEIPAHPALAGLNAEQLRNAPVWRRRALRVDDGDVVLARYGDGAAALVEHRLGSGNTIVLNTGVSNQWSALALEPGFAPLTIALVRHLAKRQSGAGASAASVGETVDIVQQAALLGAESLLNHLAGGAGILIESPDGAIAKVAGPRPAFLPREAGFYRLHIPGAAAAPVPLAVNVGVRELQFETLSAVQFSERIARVEPGEPAADQQAQATDGTLRSTPWWYLLAIVAALLLIEGFYAARLTRSGKSAREQEPQAA
jgi:hypothetical protein